MSSLSALSELYQAIFRRHAVRSFTGARLHPNDLAALERAFNLVLPLGREIRLRLVTEGVSRVFPRPLFRQVPALIALIAPVATARCATAAGYRGEHVILTATALGLDTCWVSGTYRREEALRLAEVGPGEILMAVIALGYGAPPGPLQKIVHAAVGSGRRPLAELLLPGGLESHALPDWARTALTAARYAPSAANRQPWRFLVEENAITVRIDSPPIATARGLDVGIAMFHLELGAAFAGVKGVWEWRDEPEVARFRLRLPDEHDGRPIFADAAQTFF
ncbi:MAG: hypothetical protein GX493_06675 [Firmicutes bacterium]|nr:hypothetical protein [Bacillota bacterium]